MNAQERARFDRLLEGVLEDLPSRIRRRLEAVPVIVDDQPDPELLADLGIEPDEEVLCGLHTGVHRAERSVEDVNLPETIHLFREGIVEEAGGWEPAPDAAGEPAGGAERVAKQIRITLLHEIGHHFGLDEEDLDELGYA